MSGTARGLVIASVSLAFAIVFPHVVAALGAPFYTSLATRILIFALAALSLDLILGYGGLVSFGHGVHGDRRLHRRHLFHHSAMMTRSWAYPAPGPRSWSGRSAFCCRGCSPC